MAELRLLSIEDIHIHGNKSIKIEDLTIHQKVSISFNKYGQTECPIVYSISGQDCHGYTCIKGHTILETIKANGGLYIYCFIIYEEPELAIVVLNTLRQRIDSVEMVYCVHSLLEIYTKNDLVQITGYSMEELTTFEQLFDYEWNKLSDKKQKNKDQIKMF